MTDMSEAKFTHGPWLAAARPSSVVGWPIVQAGIGRLICNVNYVQKSSIDPSVAGDKAFNMESAANARLIAAAPDLLEALQAVVRIADRKTVEFDKARVAIAKATGAATEGEWHELRRTIRVPMQERALQRGRLLRR